jgi:hypothetical protein
MRHRPHLSKLAVIERKTPHNSQKTRRSSSTTREKPVYQPRSGDIYVAHSVSCGFVMQAAPRRAMDALFIIDRLRENLI